MAKALALDDTFQIICWQFLQGRNVLLDFLLGAKSDTFTLVVRVQVTFAGYSLQLQSVSIIHTASFNIILGSLDRAMKKIKHQKTE